MEVGINPYTVLHPPKSSMTRSRFHAGPTEPENSRVCRPAKLLGGGAHRNERTDCPRDGSICMVCRSTEMKKTALSTSPASKPQQEML